MTPSTSAKNGRGESPIAVPQQSQPCPSCAPHSVLPPAGEWRSLSYRPRSFQAGGQFEEPHGLTPDAAEFASALIPLRPLQRESSPRSDRSRWRGGPTSFGPSGRLKIGTMAVPLAMCVRAISGGWVEIVYGALFTGLGCTTIIPLALRDIWGREEVYPGLVTSGMDEASVER